MYMSPAGKVRAANIRAGLRVTREYLARVVDQQKRQEGEQQLAQLLNLLRTEPTSRFRHDKCCHGVPDCCFGENCFACGCPGHYAATCKVAEQDPQVAGWLMME